MVEQPIRRHPWSGGYTQVHQPSAECSRCRRMVSKVQLRAIPPSEVTAGQDVCVGCLRADPAWTEAELRAAWGDR